MALDRRHFRVVRLWRRDEAGHHRLAVEPDCAGAALALGAALLCPGQARLVAQGIEERATGRGVQLEALAVDAGLDDARERRVAGGIQRICPDVQCLDRLRRRPQRAPR